MVDRALRNYDQAAITQFAQLLVDETPDPTWFDTQERLVYLLVYYQQEQLAKQWIDSLSELNLRARYQERIDEMEEWAMF